MKRKTKLLILSVIIPVAIFLAMTLSAFCYIALQDSAKKLLPNGKIFDIGGQMLFANIKGRGRPTVIIETDLGSSSAEWWHLQNILAKNNRVITYDRAGYGLSRKSRKPRSGCEITAELHALVEKSGTQGPYILVGHGLGGLYMQHFARKYRNEIMAVVMIEPVTLKDSRYGKEVDHTIYSNLIDKTAGLKVSYFLARIGLPRILNIMPYPDLPEQHRKFISYHYSTRKTYDTMMDEYIGNLSKSISQTEKAGKFPPVPLAIIATAPETRLKEYLSYGLSYDEADQINSIRNDLYAETAGLSPRGRIIHVPEKTRGLHVEDPKIIVDVISSFMKK